MSASPLEPLEEPGHVNAPPLHLVPSSNAEDPECNCGTCLWCDAVRRPLIDGDGTTSAITLIRSNFLALAETYALDPELAEVELATQRRIKDAEARKAKTATNKRRSR